MLHAAARIVVVLACVLPPVLGAAQSPRNSPGWPHWRGPGHTGAASANTPLTWSDTSNVRWNLYVISDSGMRHVFDAATGTPHYLQQRLPKPYNFKASPLAVHDRVYLATEEGDVVVVKSGSRFEALATNSLTDQSFIASPIALGNDLYLRSRTHLYRISER